MSSLWKSTAVTLEMIKWEHSIFALPFALTAAVLAAGGWPQLRVLGWIIVCMVAARSAAMAFNRLVDARIDAANPRTAMRAIPAGALSGRFVGGFVLVSAMIFTLGAAMLNRLAFALAPVALAVVLAYSYMKRVTRWSHLVLGLALGIAPSAAWIAVRGTLDARIVVLTVAVLLWVGGFDVLYACQDYEHDRRVGLNSVPQAFGVRGAFWIARGMHLGMLVLLCWLIALFGLGEIAALGVVLVALLLLYEHLIISPTDLRRMNAAFFTMNGVISVVFFAFVAADVFLHR
ncbi:UbiA-like polyprenyltransferase [Edaphobacter bradus]|uniref:UbiA-like polyprenyltransferase n=1 Tax=Edaphobacter bradus TaxID=2259016 RepID=UPI0021E0B752|nr:UbiA-like polyprenyltransferase [Edaphobacter bradus]